jgi:cardiolipin synthase
MDYQLFSKPREVYRQMLKDIRHAKKSVYLETYIFGNDSVGKLFKNLLTRKAKQGVKIFLLIDSWGSKVDKNFFSKLIKNGGQVRFFKEIQYVLRFFSKNHERNHRKLLIIDKKITYVGSMNITAECLDWRELVIRIKGEISQHFVDSFRFTWNISGKLTKKRVKRIIHEGYEIMQDLPSDIFSIARSRYLKLIKSSRKEILIETPYFIPPLRIRRALARAAGRGVKIRILLPYISDVKLADIVRNRYLKFLFKHKIEIYYYLPGILHSKFIVVDGKSFVLGSSNLDYRSFLHHHEINLFGKDTKIAGDLRSFFYSGIKKSKHFDYNEWKARSSFTRALEIIFGQIERYV